MTEWPFRRWLANQMEQGGLSTRELGRRSGVSHSAIVRILAGDREPRLDTVQLLAAVFDSQLVPRRIVGLEVSVAEDRRSWSEQRLDVIFVAFVSYGTEGAAKLLGLSRHTVKNAAREFRARHHALSNSHAVRLTWSRLGDRYELGSKLDGRPARWRHEASASGDERSPAITGVMVADPLD